MKILSLTSEQQFSTLNKIGQKFYTPYFILIIKQDYTLVTTTNNTVHLGFKVSKKLGKAVIRNKIKRRIRHLTRIYINFLKPNNYGIVIIPKKNFATTKFSILNEQFLRNLTNYSIINSKEVIAR